MRKVVDYIKMHWLNLVITVGIAYVVCVLHCGDMCKAPKVVHVEKTVHVAPPLVVGTATDTLGM